MRRFPKSSIDDQAMKTVRTLLPLIIVLIALQSGAFGIDENRSSGVISGKVVVHNTLRPLPGANVQVVGTAYGGVTDDDGGFKIENVPAGHYMVKASVIGFEPSILTDVVVSPIKPVILQFNLEEKSVEVGEVTVRGEYFRSTPDAPVSVKSQSNEELRRLPGGLEDVIRAVSILPGVAQVEAGRNDLVVRGGAPSENLFLIDNLEVPNINHFGTQGASGGPLSYVNLDFVQSTTFSSGGFGVRYGNKLSSVLTIDLKEGRRDRMGAKVTLSATQFGFTTEGPFDSSGSFLFSARRSYLDFIFKAAGLAFTPQYWDFMTKADYHLGRNDRLTLVGIGVIDNIRIFNDSRDHIFDNSRILMPSEDQGVAGMTWKHLFQSGFTNLSLTNMYTSFDYLQSDTLLNPVFSSVSRERITSLKSEALWQIMDNSELSFGLEGKYIQLASDLTLPSFWTNYSGNISVNAHADTTAFKAAGYAQFSQKLGRLQATLGVRWDYFNLIEQKSSVAPRGSLKYILTEQTNLNFSTGRYAQAPSYIWLLTNPDNRKLTYMTADQYVLGADHLLRSDLQISVEGYVKQYHDYPASALQPFLVLSNYGSGYGGSQEAFASFGVDPLVSEGNGVAKGVEVFIQKKLSETPFYGIMSVSFNKSEFAGLDGVRRPGSFDQRWIINLGGGYILNDEWELSAKFRFATGRPYTPYNSDGTQSAQYYNASRVKSNHSLDVRVDRRWLFSGWSLIGFIDIQNVYNKQPNDVPVYNERLGYEEDRKSIGILPSLGLSAEF
jgi:hypothetical protein